MGLHQLARDIEAKFQLHADLPVRDRGGSSANTKLALESSVRLSEAVSEPSVADALIQLDRWLRRARVILGELEFPQRLPRLPGQAEPVCPFCKHKTLRMFPLRGFIICINPSPECRDEKGRKPRATMEYSNFTCQFELVWQDNVVGLPAGEAA